jgi:guanine deaminase
MSVFLKRAVDLAIENVNHGGTPYGAVIVKDNKIIGEGVNTLHTHPDISGHAEMIAIRQAQELLGRVDLSDCVVYASGHPCPMCFGAITLSNIHKVVYANTPEEAAEVGMPLTSAIYEYLKGNKDAINLDITRDPIQEGEINPMRYWYNHNNK